jgi:hypothetical protein
MKSPRGSRIVPGQPIAGRFAACFCCVKATQRGMPKRLLRDNVAPAFGCNHSLALKGLTGLFRMHDPVWDYGASRITAAFSDPNSNISFPRFRPDTIGC